jgi:type III pantothenate kinase
LAVICIDAGNTFVKVALMEQTVAQSLSVIPTGDSDALSAHLRALPRAEGGIIANVGMPSPEIMACLLAKSDFCIELTEKTPLPIQNLYQTPATLGKDRLAAVVGAHTLHPGRNVLVIDAGTALTVDFLDHAGNYRGGNISPGLQLRYTALHEHTENLPLLTQTADFKMLGTTTASAIIAGVQFGMIFEINAYISLFRKQYADLLALITGGDAFFFENKIEIPIFAESNLIGIGLESIIRYNLVRDCR